MEEGRKINLLDLTIKDLEAELSAIGQQKFRAGQIFQWVNKGIKNIDDMTNLSKELRQELKKNTYISKYEISHKMVSKIDGTIKYIFKSEDGNIIESVLMEYKHGITACISSQVGCKMGCSFCASTGAGYARNLSAGEILDQILTMQNDTGKRIGNVVIMGIGEPLDNYNNVIKFLRIVNMKEGLNIGFRHISLSTCGLIPEIYKLADEGMPITLSISLHAPNDDIRSKIMPVNKRYSIDKLIEACKIYTEKTSRRITFEYALIKDVNDSTQYASELAKKIKGMLCHVNLIPVNEVKGAGYIKSDRRQIEAFKSILERYGIETTVRRELGSDINAACGQLRRTKMEKGTDTDLFTDL